MRILRALLLFLMLLSLGLIVFTVATIGYIEAIAWLIGGLVVLFHVFIWGVILDLC